MQLPLFSSHILASKGKKGGSVIMKLEIEMVRLSTVAVVVKGASCEHTLHGHLRHRKARSILDYATLFTFQAFSRGVCIHSYIWNVTGGRDPRALRRGRQIPFCFAPIVIAQPCTCQCLHWDSLHCVELKHCAGPYPGGFTAGFRSCVRMQVYFSGGMF